MESSWNKIYSFILLPEPRREEKISEKKIAEHPLGKSKNFPLPLALRALTCLIREILLDMITTYSSHTNPAWNSQKPAKEDCVLVWKVFIESLLMGLLLLRENLLPYSFSCKLTLRNKKQERKPSHTASWRTSFIN